MNGRRERFLGLSTYCGSGIPREASADFDLFESLGGFPVGDGGLG